MNQPNQSVSQSKEYNDWVDYIKREANKTRESNLMASDIIKPFTIKYHTS